jgi:hypothetical protein
MRQIYDTIVSPHLFEAWFEDLDPLNRGMIYASHFKKYLSSIGFNSWDKINQIVPDLHMDKVDEVFDDFVKIKDIFAFIGIDTNNSQDLNSSDGFARPVCTALNTIQASLSKPILFMTPSDY